MSEKILSVSVASYNLGEMILECLSSFCQPQVIDKLEILVTDDGSRDNTPDLAEQFASRFPSSIKVIRKQNEGPGSTVNSGIANATGKYFRMVDGDDWVKEQTLASFISFLETTDADLVVSDYDIFDNSEKKVISTERASIAPALTHSFEDVFSQIPYQMHALTYKTAFFKKAETLDNCFYTDTEYTLFPIPFVQTVAYFDKTVYMYRVAQATQSVNPASMRKNLAQHDRVLKRLLSLYESQKDTLSHGQRHFMAKRIATMADVQLGVLLTFEKSKEGKQRIKDFFAFVKEASQDVYAYFKTGKKCKLLLFSSFLLYPQVRRMYLKVIGERP
ncbi:MAG: glycosyltransferase family 2 protein [Clostridia bacterium]|nr:glycosyltransferase family 2 protein [Clostridia bacterium]